MSEQIKDFNDYREKMNEVILSKNNLVMKRLWNLDTNTYEDVANDKKKVNPIGEWNTSKIIFTNGHVEHWLNGEKILEFEAGNEAWIKEKNVGKWKDFADYGSAKKGRISLQDHGNKAYFKNIMIREL